MKLERLTTEELIEQGKEIFYDYLVSSDDFLACNEYIPCNDEFPLVMDMLHDFQHEIYNENESRIILYQKAIANPETDKECLDALNEQLQFLKEEREILAKNNMANQKKLYKTTGAIDYARTAIRVPLDKKINSYYDDFVLEVLFYDDISVLNGRYDEWKKLETKEERIAFIKANTEITHMGLTYLNQGRHVATIGLLGELNFNDPRIEEASITILPHKFSDFNKVTLADTNLIKNNDLKQFIQSKIDLDKEEALKLLADKNVGTDNYKILSVDNNEFYIRYICPSTGRIYFNNLNLRNLRLSPFFKEDDYSSYIDAWWNLNNLGADPYGKAMIRC